MGEGEVVVGLGIDLVELDRVEAMLARWGGRLVAKLMGPEEASRLPPGGAPRIRALALSIAAKEAASKALGTGWSRGVRWRDVSVDLDATPGVRLLARAAEVARMRGSSGAHRLSLEVRGNLVLAEIRLLSS